MYLIKMTIKLKANALYQPFRKYTVYSLQHALKATSRKNNASDYIEYGFKREIVPSDLKCKKTKNSKD